MLVGVNVVDSKGVDSTVTAGVVVGAGVVVVGVGVVVVVCSTDVNSSVNSKVLNGSTSSYCGRPNTPRFQVSWKFSFVVTLCTIVLASVSSAARIVKSTRIEDSISRLLDSMKVATLFINTASIDTRAAFATACRKRIRVSSASKLARVM